MANSTEPHGSRSAPKGSANSRPSQPSPASSLPGLQSAVNDSSSRTAALWLSFLTFMAYLTMTVGAVTHEALLKQTTIKLPVLNVELPLVAFFWIAPLFFLLFHFYLFLQLVILVRKVACFDATLRGAVETQQQREEYRRRLDTFLVVQFLVGAEEERKGLTGRLLRYVALITLVILPISLLLQFQLTFVPYHDAAVTWVHRIAVLIDVRLAWVFWFAIARGDGKIYFPEIQFQWGQFFKRGSFLKTVKKTGVKIGQAVSSAYRDHKAGFACSIGVLFASVFVFAFTDEPVARVVQIPVPHISDDEIVWEVKPIADVVLHGPINMVQGRPRAWFSNVLVVPDRKLVDDKVVDRDFPSLSLRGRNLSGAILIGSDLRSADFTGANLNNAVLDRAQLERARFGCAGFYDRRTKPGWPDDECTWLQRASFAQAQLQAADFTRARMHGSILIKANLQGADMSAAQLQDAMLSNAELAGASLKGANLSRAFLDGANLIGADFHNAQLQGVLVGNTHLELASIQVSSLDKTPIRIARPLPEENEKSEIEKPEDQISRYFMYATVLPGDLEFNFENVIANFDSRSLMKFRQAAITSLIPYGIIQRDFEATYEQATERKWNEIAEIVKGKQDKEGVKVFLLKFACNVGSAAFITPALIRSERIMTVFGDQAGDLAVQVIEALKTPTDQCPAAKALNPGMKLLLGDLEERANKRLTAENKGGSDNKTGSNETVGSASLGTSPAASATQAAGSR
jgi:uncharacterized protein YjbI with pentapeptide repeats